MTPEGRGSLVAALHAWMTGAPLPGSWSYPPDARLLREKWKRGASDAVAGRPPVSRHAVYRDGWKVGRQVANLEASWRSPRLDPVHPSGARPRLREVAHA